MKTLCMDSAHKHLVIVLLEGEKVVASCALVCWKKQSETIFPQLIALCEKVHWDADNIDEIVITDGPGSYTGVRIAMSIAKVLCTRKKIPLYCVSTLQLYAGLQKQAFVMLDARSNRAYTALLNEGSFVQAEGIQTLEEIKAYIDCHDVTLIGDCDLIQKESAPIDFISNFTDIKKFARRIENVHALTPRYLKEQEAYKAS